VWWCPCAENSIQLLFSGTVLSEACIKQLDGKYREQLSAGIFALLFEPQMHVTVS
jgi:hypothetical protein